MYETSTEPVEDINEDVIWAKKSCAGERKSLELFYDAETDCDVELELGSGFIDVVHRGDMRRGKTGAWVTFPLASLQPLCSRPTLYEIMPGLRVLAGTDLDNLVVIDELINSGKSHSLCSDIFDGQIVCNIQVCHPALVRNATHNTTGLPGQQWQCSRQRILPPSRQAGHHMEHPSSRSVISNTTFPRLIVPGRFLKEYSSDDILFGNTFDRPLNLPWGSGVALKFMKCVTSLPHRPYIHQDPAISTLLWSMTLGQRRNHGH